MPEPPKHINSKPPKTGAQHVIELLGVNVSTAVTLTAHTSPTPLFVISNAPTSATWAVFV